MIIDERISKDPNSGERFLLPVPDDCGASAICLVDPWACVEDSYANVERRTVKPGGSLLVVADSGRAVEGLAESFAPGTPPSHVAAVCHDDTQRGTIQSMTEPLSFADDIAELPDRSFDDIVYFGADKSVIETLNSKLAARCIINIVTGGERIGEPVAIGLGRIHYGMTRWIGTTSASAVDAYRMIPETGEIREGEGCIIVGAAGPMGQMHVIRNICAGIRNISIVATDLDDTRLESLRRKAETLARTKGVNLRVVNPKKHELNEKFSYAAIMVPAPQLVSEAIADSVEGCFINIFAGIPASTIHEIDLDLLIANRCFIFGTSGSVLSDMKTVLQKIETGALDTNISVDAVSGMAGAADGIAAVEDRTLAGKIIVYPELHHLGLVRLDDMTGQFPTVAKKLDNGRWTRAAEEELLSVAK